jgi:hypothetical protein
MNFRLDVPGGYNCSKFSLCLDNCKNVTLESAYGASSSLQTAWCVSRSPGACAADRAVVRPCGPRRHHRSNPSHFSGKAEYRRYASAAARPTSDQWRWRQLLPDLRVDFPGLELLRIPTAKIAGAGRVRTNNTFHQNRSRNFHTAVHRLPIACSTSRLNWRSSLSSSIAALPGAPRSATKISAASHLRIKAPVICRDCTSAKVWGSSPTLLAEYHVNPCFSCESLQALRQSSAHSANHFRRGCEGARSAGPDTTLPRAATAVSRADASAGAACTNVQPPIDPSCTVAASKRERDSITSDHRARAVYQAASGSHRARTAYPASAARRNPDDYRATSFRSRTAYGTTKQPRSSAQQSLHHSRDNVGHQESRNDRGAAARHQCAG